MPTKGNKPVRARTTAEEMAEIEEEIRRRNLHWRGPAWDVSGYVRAAIKEFKRKRAAGRAPRGQRPGRRGRTPPEPFVFPV